MWESWRVVILLLFNELINQSRSIFKSEFFISDIFTLILLSRILAVKNPQNAEMSLPMALIFFFFHYKHLRGFLFYCLIISINFLSTVSQVDYFDFLSYFIIFFITWYPISNEGRISYISLLNIEISYISNWLSKYHIYP